MSWDNREKEELKLDEGLRLKPYKDTLGVVTVGYGHTSDKNHPADKEITEQEALDWLDEDFEEAVQDATKYVLCFDGLSGPRKGAVCNMAFQLGGKTLGTFHEFLHLLDIGDYKAASDDLVRTLWYKQTPYRALRIAYRIKTNDYAAR